MMLTVQSKPVITVCEKSQLFYAKQTVNNLLSCSSFLTSGIERQNPP